MYLATTSSRSLIARLKNPTLSIFVMLCIELSLSCTKNLDFPILMVLAEEERTSSILMRVPCLLWTCWMPCKNQLLLLLWTFFGTCALWAARA